MGMRIHPVAHILRFLSGDAHAGGFLAGVGGQAAAGLTLAAIAIPEQMATARLAGFAPETGFFVFIAATIAFTLFGASRTLSVGADSTIAPIFAGSLAVLAATGSPLYAGLAATLALMVGVLVAAAGVARLGRIASLLSIPVTTGFLAGIAIHIVLLQMPAFLGLPAAGGTPFSRLIALLAQLGETNLYAFGIGLAVFAASLAAERINPRLPGPLAGLAAASLAVAMFHLERQHVQVLGAIRTALPQLGLAVVPAEDYAQLAGLALIVAMVVMVQTAATIRAFAAQTGQAPDINRDFIGAGLSNVLAGFLGLFPVNASPPRTAAVVQSGGRSRTAGIVAVLAMALILFFAPGLLAAIPVAGLAGLLLFIAVRITRFGLIAEIFRRSRIEFLLVLATAMAIVALPIQTGVTIGVFLSLLHGIWTITRTRLIAMERIPGTSVWWPPVAGSRSETIPGVLVLAYQAPLSFLNADDFQRDAQKAIGKTVPPPKLVVLEASSIVEIDYTAAQALITLVRHCKETGTTFAVARLESVRGQQAMVRLGVMRELGPDSVFRSVQEAIDALLPRLADGNRQR